jgi:hypothetical protein
MARKEGEQVIITIKAKIHADSKTEAVLSIKAIKRYWQKIRTKLETKLTEMGSDFPS